ncbi:MAG: hypothetical protein ACW99U_15225 [Candidatus Thorarchaeota archaeon]|jgi:hypothetical protein
MTRLEELVSSFLDPRSDSVTRALNAVSMVESTFLGPHIDLPTDSEVEAVTECLEAFEWMRPDVGHELMSYWEDWEARVDNQDLTNETLVALKILRESCVRESVYICPL